MALAVAVLAVAVAWEILVAGADTNKTKLFKDFIKLKQRIFRDLSKQYFSYCTARQCLSLRQKFIECSIINPALSLLTKHLDIGKHQKAPNFSAFH